MEGADEELAAAWITAVVEGFFVLGPGVEGAGVPLAMRAFFATDGAAHVLLDVWGRVEGLGVVGTAGGMASNFR